MMKLLINETTHLIVLGIYEPNLFPQQQSVVTAIRLIYVELPSIKLNSFICDVFSNISASKAA